MDYSSWHVLKIFNLCRMIKNTSYFSSLFILRRVRFFGLSVRYGSHDLFFISFTPSLSSFSNTLKRFGHHNFKSIFRCLIKLSLLSKSELSCLSSDFCRHPCFFLTIHCHTLLSKFNLTHMFLFLLRPLKCSLHLLCVFFFKLLPPLFLNYFNSGLQALMITV